MTTPSATDITAGLNLDGYEPLSAAQRRVVYTLIARSAERAYRRGFQQGAHMTTARPDDLHADLHGWRYTMSTDASPAADGRPVTSALERLIIEDRSVTRVLGPQPRRAGGAAVEERNYVRELRDLAAERFAAVRDSDAARQAVAYQRLRAFGIELDAIGGSAKMVEVYDGAIDEYGEDAVAGVLPVWDGISGEYFS